MLSEQTLHELRRERERLVRICDEARTDIEAIDKLLGKAPTNVLKLESPAAADERYAEIGLRDAIRDILARSSGFLKPKEIAREATRGGYKVHSGTTSLEARVANEAFRMCKSGEIVRSKRRGGGFSMPRDKSVEGSLR